VEYTVSLWIYGGRADAWIILMRNILYTAGSHGNFVKYLFDSYDQNKMLPTRFNNNGNSHKQPTTIQDNRIFDVCNEALCGEFKNQYQHTDHCYNIIWEGLDQFCYILQCYTDRGASLTESGVDMLEKSVSEYENKYGVPVYISTVLKNSFNFDCTKHNKTPRGLLRNYFLLSFYNYFENICWKENQKLINSPHEKINLTQIWDYDSLQKKLYKIFDKSLDFKLQYEQFLSQNKPLQQLTQIQTILLAIEAKQPVEFTNLNVISEAYILFVLERQHFNIPFLIGNTFYKDSRELSEYIDYFPEHMKKPNNLFCTHYKYYQRNADVDI